MGRRTWTHGVAFLTRSSCTEANQMVPGAFLGCFHCVGGNKTKLDLVMALFPVCDFNAELPNYIFADRVVLTDEQTQEQDKTEPIPILLLLLQTLIVLFYSYICISLLLVLFLHSKDLSCPWSRSKNLEVLLWPHCICIYLFTYIRLFI